MATGQIHIERVAQLAAKPRASLRLRFGADVLLRLDQALGPSAWLAHTLEQWWLRFTS